MTKQCSKCGESKTLDNYRPQSGICKSCISIKNRDYADKNREKIKEIWRQQNQRRKEQNYAAKIRPAPSEYVFTRMWQESGQDQKAFTETFRAHHGLARRDS